MAQDLAGAAAAGLIPEHVLEHVPGYLAGGRAALASRLPGGSVNSSAAAAQTAPICAQPGLIECRGGIGDLTLSGMSLASLARRRLDWGEAAIGRERTATP